MEKPLRVWVSPVTVSVTWEGPTFVDRGTAEATWMENDEGNGYWYVNRVLVRPEVNRRHGIGSLMLKELLAQAKAFDTGMGREKTKVVVTPGGYNEDLARQNRFYAKNGFIDVENVMVWEG